jgi:hypothetical protein
MGSINLKRGVKTVFDRYQTSYSVQRKILCTDVNWLGFQLNCSPLFGIWGKNMNTVTYFPVICLHDVARKERKVLHLTRSDNKPTSPRGIISDMYLRVPGSKSCWDPKFLQHDTFIGSRSLPSISHPIIHSPS